MRAAMWSAALVLGLAAAAIAQDVRQPEDWKKMYEDASAQLRAAQDRKSELASDNAKLTAQVALFPACAMRPPLKTTPAGRFCNSHNIWRVHTL